MRLSSGTALYWTSELHKYRGNILYADSHVEQITTPGLGMPSSGVPGVMDLTIPTLNNGSPSPASAGPALTPPSNLPAPPGGTAAARQAPSSSPDSSSVFSLAVPTSGSGGSHSTRPVVNSGRAATGIASSSSIAVGARSNVVKKIVVRTNTPPVTNAAPPVVAAAPPVNPFANGHWPWWFWLWLVLLLIAAEGTRRYYARQRRERKRRSQWARPDY